MEILQYNTNESDIFEKEQDDEIVIKPYEVDCLPNDYNVTTLVSLIERGYMKIPSFQRNYIWKRDMASKFIESIIIGLPIPQLFLFERERNNFLVIDGQQRLVTIYLFKKQRFPKNNQGRAIIRDYLSKGEPIPDQKLIGDDFEDFKLKLSSTGQKNALNKLTYDTLSTITDYDFKGEFDFNRTIRTITIKEFNADENDSAMFEIFSRLNSGGVMLRPQEIRMSIFYSLFYQKMVSDFNKYPEWREFLGKREPDLHMSDVEALVRAFAMLETSDDYRPPLKNFLNNYSKMAMDFDEEDIEKRWNLFKDFWESCKSLETNEFRNGKNKFVVSLFESVFVAVCEMIQHEGLNGRTIDIDSLESLKLDKDFINASQGNTASFSSVKTRLLKARQIIKLQ